MGNSELLPCPFCGAEVSKGRDMWTSGNGWYIECSACKARSGVAWDTGKVAAAWNTRAETRAERDLRDEVNWLNSELHGAEMGRTCRIKNTTDICNRDFCTTAKCSRCMANYTIDFKYLKFCPNCGAKVVKK